MNYFYERDIVEIKNEYTNFLISIMTPLIYEGIESLYKHARITHQQLSEKGKFNPNVRSPGILSLFQQCLKEVPGLNDISIEKETQRIKEGSKCSDFFDNLVKAVIKSHIIFKAHGNTRNIPEAIRDKSYERIDIKNFIHKCYIESARELYNNPELFWHEYPVLEIKRNQRDAYEKIKQAINTAIWKMLPVASILKDYLKAEYMPEQDVNMNNNISEAQVKNMRGLVNKDLLNRQEEFVPIENIQKQLQIQKQSQIFQAPSQVQTPKENTDLTKEDNNLLDDEKVPDEKEEKKEEKKEETKKKETKEESEERKETDESRENIKKSDEGNTDENNTDENTRSSESKSDTYSKSDSEENDDGKSFYEEIEEQMRKLQEQNKKKESPKKEENKPVVKESPKKVENKESKPAVKESPKNKGKPNKNNFLEKYMAK